MAKKLKKTLIVLSVIADIIFMFSCVEAGNFILAAIGFMWLAAVVWANR